MKKALVALLTTALIVLPAASAQAVTRYVWDWSPASCANLLGGTTTWVFDSRVGYRTLCTYRTAK